MRYPLRVVARRCVQAASGRVGVVVGVQRPLWRSGLLLAPVMHLAAGVVAESLVPATFPTAGMRASVADYATTIFAADNVTAGRYQPVHL